MIKILLIDQEILFQQAFSKLVEDMDCELIGTVGSLAEAEEVLCEETPDIIFSEMVVENLNGVDICVKLKENNPMAKIYLLSNYYTRERIEDTVRIGAEELLYKPVSKTKIQEIIGIYTENSKQEEQKYKWIYENFEKKDYALFRSDMREFVEKIFLQTEEKRLEKELKNLAYRLYRMIVGMEEEQITYYEKKNPYRPDYCKNKNSAFEWLMEIVTELFKQQIVIKYPFFSQIYVYIEKNINQDIRVTDLATKVGVSTGYLSKIFKKYYNISLIDYIHIRKIQKAKLYLKTSELNISDIALLLGYSEAGYFSKVFKKYEGMTPMEFNQ